MKLKLKANLVKTIGLPSFEGKVKLFPIPLVKMGKIQELASSFDRESPKIESFSEMAKEILEFTDVDNPQDILEGMQLADFELLINAAMNQEKEKKAKSKQVFLGK